MALDPPLRQHLIGHHCGRDGCVEAVGLIRRTFEEISPRYTTRKKATTSSWPVLGWLTSTLMRCAVLAKPVLIFLAMLGVMAAAPVLAGPLSVPKDGSGLAMVVEPPAGWETEYDANGNLMISAADNSGSVQITMIEDPSVASTSTSDVANLYLKSVNGRPWTRIEPGKVADVAGETYVSTFPVAGAPDEILKLTIAKLDGSHLALVQVVWRTGATGDQADALVNLAARVTIAKR